MTMVSFLLEWTLRSSILVMSGLLLLKLFRISDPATRLVGCAILLAGSLLMPVLTFLAPRADIPIPRILPESHVTAQRLTGKDSTLPVINSPEAKLEEAIQSARYAKPLNWDSLLLLLYSLGVCVMLIRLGTGLIMGRQLIRRSRSLRGLMGDDSEISDIRESDEIAVPVAMGLWHCVILLPNDWTDWDGSTLKAVLAHERSHVRRRDPLVQVISAVHRSLMWHNPLSWYVHTGIAQLAEDASDDIALAAIGDRGHYAEILLGFMQRSALRTRGEGVAMASYGSVDKRIDRILNEVKLSRGVTWFGIVAVLVLTAPMIYVAAAARPRTLQPVRPTMGFMADSTALLQPDVPAAEITLPISNSEQAAASTGAFNARQSERTATGSVSDMSKADRAKPAEPSLAPPVTAAVPGSSSVQGQVSPEMQTSPAPSSAQKTSFDAYAIVSKDSATGSFNVFKDPATGQVIDDVSHTRQLRSRFGNDFAWFRRDGKEFVVTDNEIVSASVKALAPEEEFAHTRGRLDRLLTALERENSSSSRVPSILIQQLQDIEAELESQPSVAGLAEQLNAIILELQYSTADEQRQLLAPKLTRLQAKLSQEGNRLAGEFHRTFRNLLNVATEKGLAQEISLGV